MKKLTEVRQFLLDAMPEYKIDPDRFVTFVEDGAIEWSRGESLSHGYRYTAQIVMLEFTRNVDHVIVPLIAWMQRYQPDTDPHDAVRFEAEILDEGVVDLIIRVKLDERVVVKRDAESGAVTAEHRVPAFDIGLPDERRWNLDIDDKTQGMTWTI